MNLRGIPFIQVTHLPIRHRSPPVGLCGCRPPHAAWSDEQTLVADVFGRPFRTQEASTSVRRRRKNGDSVS